MTGSKKNERRILVADTPVVPRPTFRCFAGKVDPPGMVADELDETATIEDVERTCRHLVQRDANRDIFFAGIRGEFAGYGPREESEWSGHRCCGLLFPVRPEW